MSCGVFFEALRLSNEPLLLCERRAENIRGEQSASWSARQKAEVETDQRLRRPMA
jgi:hypothetical protein